MYLINACILLRKGFLTNALAGGYLFEYGDFSITTYIAFEAGYYYSFKNVKIAKSNTQTTD